MTGLGNRERIYFRRDIPAQAASPSFNVSQLLALRTDGGAFSGREIFFISLGNEKGFFAVRWRRIDVHVIGIWIALSNSILPCTQLVRVYLLKRCWHQCGTAAPHP